MAGIVDDLKTWARILHGQGRGRDRAALTRLRALPELAALEDEALAASVKRKHCLAVIARGIGFDGWSQAVAILTGAGGEDFGTLLCPPSVSAHWNIWSASYEEARAIRAEHGGYLLAYRRQFLITDRHYIEALGLDPDHPDWERIGRDWARPADPAARVRLYGELVRKRAAEPLAPSRLEARRAALAAAREARRA